MAMCRSETAGKTLARDSEKSCAAWITRSGGIAVSSTTGIVVAAVEVIPLYLPIEIAAGQKSSNDDAKNTARSGHGAFASSSIGLLRTHVDARECRSASENEHRSAAGMTRRYGASTDGLAALT